MGDVLDFLDHASERGLMPAATAAALATAVRNVFGVLTDAERDNLAAIDLEGAIRRFSNKRARDFNPSTLKEYGRRVHRAIALFQQWREDPANFSAKTRTTKVSTKKQRNGGSGARTAVPLEVALQEPTSATSEGGYQSSISIRPNWVVTITNVPVDLTDSEAERLANFVRLLAMR